MACAGTDDNLGFIAAALSAMTDKHIVSKSEYITIQQRARSGIDTGYIFKGNVDVPQMVKQTYADTYQLVTQLQSSIIIDTVDDTPNQEERNIWSQFVSNVVKYFTIGGEDITTEGAGDAIELSTLAAVSSSVAEGAFKHAEMNEMEHRHEETKPAAVVEDQTPLINSESLQILISSSDGIDICINLSSNMDTVHQLKLRIQQKLGIKTDCQCLSYQGTLLQDTDTIQSHNITNNSTVTLSVRIRGGGGSKELHYLDSTHMDPSWDYDFTNVSDGTTKYKRGGYQYYRPCGWKRIAINVTERYGDKTWLGHTDSKGEWAVSYHGTSQPVFDKICEQGYKVGTRNFYGSGVYSSPYISEAERYASKFNHNGANYLGVFQNRVNPKRVNIVNGGKYWVCPNPTNIRPYGLCVKACF